MAVTVSGAFCMIGSHVVPLQSGHYREDADRQGVKLVRASFDKRTGKWVPNPESPASVLVCKDHQKGVWE